MDLRWSEEDETFRAELRAWLEPALRVLGQPPARDDWKGRRRCPRARHVTSWPAS